MNEVVVKRPDDDSEYGWKKLRCEMRNDVTEKALQVLTERRRSAEQEYEERMQPLYCDPRFATLNAAYTQIMIENARKEAYGHKQFEQTERDLKNDLDNLKKEYGVQDLEPNYSCKMCRDRGYVDGEPCICLKKEISKILLAESGFDKLEDFASSKATSGELAPAYELMQKWCQSNFKKDLILLSGPTGIGKTHLVRCMANELIQRGCVIKIATAYRMNQDFREFSKTQKEDLLNRYTTPQVLFIDDLGTEPAYKNVTLENFYLILNERKMRKLPTVITTNLDLADILERYDERISSRIADRETSITLLLSGTDKRLKK